MKKQKEQIKSIVKGAKQIKKAQANIFEIITKTNKRLYDIAEQLALKEIQKDPLEFIRKESIALGQGENLRMKSMRRTQGGLGGAGGGGTEEFHSFEEESQINTLAKKKHDGFADI